MVAKCFENIEPAGNTSLGQVISGTTEDMDAACEAAADAFPQWSQISGQERKRILHHFADLIEERAEEIALVEASDCGQAIRFMKQAAVRGAAKLPIFCRQGAGGAKRLIAVSTRPHKLQP